MIYASNIWDCYDCVYEFATQDGACECILDNTCSDIANYTPEGCDQCGEAAYMWCSQRTLTSPLSFLSGSVFWNCTRFFIAD